MGLVKLGSNGEGAVHSFTGPKLTRSALASHIAVSTRAGGLHASRGALVPKREPPTLTVARIPIAQTMQQWFHTNEKQNCKKRFREFSH
jgi:hypothetical protein